MKQLATGEHMDYSYMYSYCKSQLPFFRIKLQFVIPCSADSSFIPTHGGGLPDKSNAEHVN